MMRRIVVVVGSLVLTLGLAGSAIAAVQNTAHDLSTGSGYYTGLSGTSEQICVFCHTPHWPSGATTDPYALPLWNHKLSTQSYTPYSSQTIDNTPAAFSGTDVGQTNPANYSALCLSCHDGTVAVGDVYNIPQDLEASRGQGPGRILVTDTGGVLDATGHIQPTRTGYIGTDLSYHHPVNMTYDEGNDPGLNGPADNCCIQYTAGSCDVPLYSADCVTTRGTVQCASCHEPHNAAGIDPFLRYSMTDSALCTLCHQK